MYLGAIPGDPDEVIVSTNDPDMVTVWMGRPARIHDLRHTAVALWIAAGASPKEVAARPGTRR